MSDDMPEFSFPVVGRCILTAASEGCADSAKMSRECAGHVARVAGEFVLEQSEASKRLFILRAAVLEFSEASTKAIIGRTPEGEAIHYCTSTMISKLMKGADPDQKV